MREVRMTDRELQALIAPALNAKLRAGGFVPGKSSEASSFKFIDGFFFPVFLDLAGHVEVCRDEDGTWSFTQEVDVRLLERTCTTYVDHNRACTELSIKVKGE